MRAPLAILLAGLSWACTSQEREPIEVQRGADQGSVAELPPGEEVPALDADTRGLLERLLAGEPAADPASVPAAPDERPVCLDLGFPAGRGPFRVGGLELPPAAAEAALSGALVDRFALEGPLAGPRAIGWGELFDLDDPSVPALIEAPLPVSVRDRARVLGGEYLLLGRLERLEHERVVIYVPERSQYEPRERGRVRLSFELYELEHGALVCAESIDRRYSLDGLAPAELASAEHVLAAQAAQALVALIESCLSSAAETPR